MDGWPDPTDVQPDPPICSGCEQEIDPDLCHCGEDYKSHNAWAGHAFCPMGCECGYER